MSSKPIVRRQWRVCGRNDRVGEWQSVWRDGEPDAHQRWDAKATYARGNEDLRFEFRALTTVVSDERTKVIDV